MDDGERSSCEGDKTVSSCGMAARRCQILDFALRSVALGGALLSAILMSKNKQTVAGSEVSYTYSPPFQFFLVINCVAFGYAVLSLNYSLASIIAARAYSFPIFLRGIFDLIIAGLLGFGVGATGAVGQILWKGNDHFGWNEICSVYDVFCRRLLWAIACSAASLLIFFVLGSFTVLTVYLRLLL